MYDLYNRCLYFSKQYKENLTYILSPSGGIPEGVTDWHRGSALQEDEGRWVETIIGCPYREGFLKGVTDWRRGSASLFAKVDGSKPSSVIAGWRSLEARRSHKPKVVGSNPIPALWKGVVAGVDTVRAPVV